MPARAGEPLAALAVDDPTAPDPTPPATALRAAREPRRAAFWLYWTHLATLFGLAISNIFLGLSVLAAPSTERLRRLAHRDVRAVLVAAAAYVLLLGLSVVTSFDPRHSVGDLSEIFAFATLLVGLVVADSERAVRRLVDAVLLLCLLESGVGLVQLALAGGPDLAHRIQGSLSHYMTFAGVLLIGDLLLCARVASRGLAAGWRGLALLPINAALLACLTRNAWVGLVCGGATLLLLSRRRLLLWMIPAVLLLLLLMPATVLDRVASIADVGDPTNSDRLCMARAGLQMIRERPLVGQGSGMVEERYPLYRLPEATRKNVPHLHDAFLEIAAERGLPALGALLALLALPAAAAWRGYRREGGRDGPRADLWLGVVAALVGFAVAGLFEDNWGDTEVRRLVLLVMVIPYALGEAPVERSPLDLAPVGPRAV